MAENVSLARREAFADAETDVARDYLVRKDGRVYAGSHVLVDFWGASNLSEPELIEKALREAAEECGATVLHTHVHEFSPNGGVSGVAVLAESHISVHTWPEFGFAAFDIFMCGNCAPENALPVLRRVFRPDREQVGEHKRGLIE
jgi:S-adenosylmethionine decarboxylase